MKDQSSADKAKEILSQVFGLRSFRTGQAEIIASVLEGNHTLAVMPTGGGKSLCYQLPAVCLGGLTLVVCPLIALMKDQVDSLLVKGVRASSLHGGLTSAQQREILRDAENGEISMLFVAPERFRNPQFQQFLKNVRVNLLVVDEAHCISQWGHDFRPDYRRIGELRESIGMPVTIALTATASPQVQRDIVTQLHIEDADTHILGFDRPNLLFRVEKLRRDADKLDFALSYVKERLVPSTGAEQPFEGCGLFYASTRKQAEKACEFFRQHGVMAGLYHAGLSDDERTLVQDRFMADAYDCMIATTAFGMGVDKPDIRYVIHLSVSSGIEAYTQESGRAGRDGKSSECILLYAPKDVKIQEFFVENGFPVKKNYMEIVKVLNRYVGSSPDFNEILDEVRDVKDSVLDTVLRKFRSSGHIASGRDNEVGVLREIEDKVWKGMAKIDELQKDAALDRLKSLVFYAYEKTCRTKFILKYFGVRNASSFNRCYHCDLCRAVLPAVKRSDKPFPEDKIHIFVLKILSAVARLCRHKPSREDVVAHLCGNAAALDKDLSTFSLLSEVPAKELKIMLQIFAHFDIISPSLSHCFLKPEGIKILTAKKLTDLPKDLRRFLTNRYENATKSH